MIKVLSYKLRRLGQSFLDEVWGDDDEDGRISPGPKNPSGRISPQGPQGVINEENYSQYEPSSVEEPVENQPTMYQRGEPAGQPQKLTNKEELGIPEEAPEIEYNGSVDPRTGQNLDQQQQIYDGIKNLEVISFDYTDRFGQYRGRRTVEPHYTFPAATGNEILVTFDREKNDIRAFIVGNIHPYGVRYENVLFDPRGEIMRGITQ